MQVLEFFRTNNFVSAYWSKPYRLVHFWLLGLLAGLLIWPTALTAAPKLDDLTKNEGITATEILVGLRPNQVRAASLDAAIAAEIGMENIASIEDYDTRGVASVSCEEQSVAGLRITVNSSDPESIAATIAQHSDVLFAVLNYPVFAADRILPMSRNFEVDSRLAADHSLFTVQNSPELSPLVFEIDDPLYEQQSWYMEQINALAAIEEVFDAQNADASDAEDPIVVAIIDSGIDAEHPEFTGRLMPGHNFLQPSQIPDDDYGHGTHVAGLIGAATNNGIGVVGTAPNVVILPYKTLDQNGGGTIDNVVKAICRAVDDGADIINLSLTSPSQNTEQYTAAFNYASEHGVLMIAAAGNSRQTRNMWPARLSNVMAIAATNIDGEIASYSSPGDNIDMAAPGGEFDEPIISTWPSDVSCNGLTPVEDPAGGTYCDSIGTSMAAALVSGVAAVLKEFHPDVTAADISTVLTGTVAPLDESSDRAGMGLLDAERAVVGAMKSQMEVSPVFETRVVPLNGLPFSIDISMVNPSFEVLEWLVTGPAYSWLSFTPAVGTARFGKDGYLSVNITPTDLTTGTYNIPLTITGIRPDQTKLYQGIQILFRVDDEPDPNGQLLIKGPEEADLGLSSFADVAAKSIELTNLGNEELSWSATIDFEPQVDEAWLQITSQTNGVIGYLGEAQISYDILPGKAPIGLNKAKITISAQRSDGSFSITSTTVSVNIIPGLLLPLILSGEGSN